jgi:uncharacterized protein YgbK (DUF1537 family)
METKLLKTLFSSYPVPDKTVDVESMMRAALKGWHKKIVVLDDDPTGVQTVHEIPVYSTWEQEDIDAAFAEDGMFFILTNSRSMTKIQAEQTNRDIARRVLNASRETGKDFVIVSRSDSTLRGYYPLETETLRAVLENEGEIFFDGEILCPFFAEGGRYTVEDVHYIQMEGKLVPVGETEFAADRSFGYRNSNLAMWVEEKTEGKYQHEGVFSISLETLRRRDVMAVCDVLMKTEHFAKVIVNALCDDDIRVFCAGYIEANRRGKNFLFRSAATIPKILGGVSDRPLLEGKILRANSKAGGLVVIGSHVMNTTRQLETLRSLDGVAFIEFDQHFVLDAPAFEAEIARVKDIAYRRISEGQDTVIYTRRERLDMNTENPQDEFHLSHRISDALTCFVKDLTVQPAYIIAKGGITSSNIGTVGLSSKRALVMGQIIPGVPVWKLGPESKFPGMAYVIFPGNVGEGNALKLILEKLRR